MTLTDATQAKLTQAFADKEAATTADAADQAAADALALATEAKAETIEASLAAHQVATQSAHDAIDAISAELGFALPSTTA